ncbi:hypothetical protein GA0115246_115294 [Streptomyces sp. SolWspMP-sol7th]|nr:hypothetical protein GA0115246_115294 [Streptomyces sp. SolWspMP-sol7th]
MTIKTVLFDFSGTLLRIESAEEWLRGALAATGHVLPEARLVELAAALERVGAQPGGAPGAPARFPDARTAELWPVRDESAAAHRAAYTGLSRHVPLPHDALHEELYARHMRPEGWRPYPDAHDVLAGLRARGIRVGVVSNVGWDIRPVFRAHGLDAFVDAYTLSFEHGVREAGRAALRDGVRGAGRERPGDADGGRQPRGGRRRERSRLRGPFRGTPPRDRPPGGAAPGAGAGGRGGLERGSAGRRGRGRVLDASLDPVAEGGVGTGERLGQQPRGGGRTRTCQRLGRTTAHGAVRRVEEEHEQGRVGGRLSRAGGARRRPSSARAAQSAPSNGSVIALPLPCCLPRASHGARTGRLRGKAARRGGARSGTRAEDFARARTSWARARGLSRSSPAGSGRSVRRP